jgi:tripartite-type tricarboxylate transporter receptor subunit TctC
MKLLRRQFLHLAAGAAAFSTVTRNARAQAYPTRPVRWVCGWSPGGAADIVSRIMAPWLAERLGQSVIVENRAGAASNISAQTVANSPADGYTLLLISVSLAVNASSFEGLTYNLLRDFAPISGIVDVPLVMVANPSAPAKTIAELIALAQADPGKLNLASYGVGSTSHVAGELFKMMAGIKMQHVPYRGGAPMVTDLIAGQVQFGIDVLTGSLAHIRSGALRGLAMLSKTRSDMLPNVPTIDETVAGYEVSGWFGLGAPKGTPPDIIERLHRDINAGLGHPSVKARLADVAATPLLLTPTEFGAFMAAEVEKWSKVVKFAGIKPV